MDTKTQTKVNCTGCIYYEPYKYIKCIRGFHMRSYLNKGCKGKNSVEGKE